MMRKVHSFVLRTAVVAALGMISVSCATEPPADPEQVFSAAFDLPVSSVAMGASGGTAADAWLCFDCEERVQLNSDEAFELVDPAAAKAYFHQALKADGPKQDSTGLVCLESSDSVGGQWLLFELGSGRYYYRSWLDS